jgi:hypothetical protein
MRIDENYYKLVYPKIIEALRLAAAPAKEQLSSLPEYVCKADEVALIFEEIFTYAKIVMENNFLSDNLYNHLLEIDNLFSEFGKDEWTEEAMHKSKVWELVRNKARGALKEFDEVYTVPNLFWITCVQNDK